MGQCELFESLVGILTLKLSLLETQLVLFAEQVISVGLVSYNFFFNCNLIETRVELNLFPKLLFLPDESCMTSFRHGIQAFNLKLRISKDSNAYLPVVSNCWALIELQKESHMSEINSVFNSEEARRESQAVCNSVRKEERILSHLSLSLFPQIRREGIEQPTRLY
jgi:hypothetical protein